MSPGHPLPPASPHPSQAQSQEAGRNGGRNLGLCPDLPGPSQRLSRAASSCSQGRRLSRDPGAFLEASGSPTFLLWSEKGRPQGLGFDPSCGGYLGDLDPHSPFSRPSFGHGLWTAVLEVSLRPHCVCARLVQRATDEKVNKQCQVPGVRKCAQTRITSSPSWSPRTGSRAQGGPGGSSELVGLLCGSRQCPRVGGRWGGACPTAQCPELCLPTGLGFLHLHSATGAGPGAVVLLTSKNPSCCVELFPGSCRDGRERAEGRTEASLSQPDVQRPLCGQICSRPQHPGQAWGGGWARKAPSSWLSRPLPSPFSPFLCP